MYRAREIRCVDCEASLERVRDARGRELERCARCGGIWMDEAAFLADLAEAQPRLASDELLEYDDGSPRRPCLVCGAAMEIVWIELLQLDRCAQHGVWFDPGELERALAGDAMPRAVQEAVRKLVPVRKPFRRTRAIVARVRKVLATPAPPPPPVPRSAAMARLRTIALAMIAPLRSLDAHAASRRRPGKPKRKPPG
jgi:Zn-finger nucleic acid-binding protein